jgi:hypothetical protein
MDFSSEDSKGYCYFVTDNKFSVASRISKLWGIVPHSTEKMWGI